jgi:phosphate transport system substrate-binding protein
MRFKTGTSRLDARSEQDWARISDLISSGMMAGNDLILAGFSDSVGNFNGNLNLSRARAAYLKTVVLEENPNTLTADNIKTFGFGPVAPVGCNNTADGRTLNRRVEVWIRGENEQPLQ